MFKKIGIGFLLFVLAAFVYYQVWFLRQPDRNIPFDETTFISPANGKVAAVTYWEKDSLEWQKDAAAVQVLTSDMAESGWLIAIEMDITNVHYQRAPVSSRVLETEYTEGKFQNALVKTNKYGFRLQNERNTFTLQTPEGLKYKIVQVAGLVARRIVDFVEPNQQVKQGEVIGLIKLGSQVALIVPSSVEPLVKEGDYVVDGESVLARMKK